MKILNIYGSSPAGTSAAVTNIFLQTARDLGAEIESFTLEGSNISNCKKCLWCKTTGERCVIEDDITPILESIQTCDVVVISTGIYVYDVTGDLSIFESRLFSLFNPDYEINPGSCRLSPGKKLVYVQAQGGQRWEHNDIPIRFDNLFRSLGFDDVFIIFIDKTDNPEELKGRDDIKNQAVNVAQKVMAHQKSEPFLQQEIKWEDYKNVD